MPFDVYLIPLRRNEEQRWRAFGRREKMIKKHDFPLWRDYLCQRGRRAKLKTTTKYGTKGSAANMISTFSISKERTLRTVSSAFVSRETKCKLESGKLQRSPKKGITTRIVIWKSPSSRESVPLYERENALLATFIRIRKRGKRPNYGNSRQIIIKLNLKELSHEDNEPRALTGGSADKHEHNTTRAKSKAKCHEKFILPRLGKHKKRFSWIKPEMKWKFILLTFFCLFVFSVPAHSNARCLRPRNATLSLISVVFLRFCWSSVSCWNSTDDVRLDEAVLLESRCKSRWD